MLADDIEKTIRALKGANLVANKLRKELDDLQRLCRHRDRKVITDSISRQYIYCNICHQKLGYKCDKREDSPCSYNLKQFMPEHASCRHGCGRLYEDDCQ